MDDCIQPITSVLCPGMIKVHLHLGMKVREHCYGPRTLGVPKTQPLTASTMYKYKIVSVCRLTDNTYCDCCKQLYENKSHDIATLYNMHHLHVAEIMQNSAGDCNLTILQLTDINREQDKLNDRIIRVL